jgi:hypothetical protein
VLVRCPRRRLAGGIPTDAWLRRMLIAKYADHLMSPTAFLQHPLRWLQAISNYKGTHCGGPNFA